MSIPCNNRIQYLTKTNFIRNYPIDDLLRNNHYEIKLTDFICYCVGIMGGKRFVHAIKILSKTPSPGITSYEVSWWDTASYCLNDELPDEVSYESVCFWVHSGVSLRKHFFLFDDRMSLIRSSFIYDEVTDHYYRLCSLLPYVYIPIVTPTGKTIYTAPSKTYLYQKVIKKGSNELQKRRNDDVKKYLKKFVKQFNHFDFLEKDYPRLFEEVIKIVDSK